MVSTSPCDEAGVEQFADQEAQSAGGVEMVHVGAAVGIHARQQRHHRRQRIEVFQAQLDAGRGRDRDQVQQVVGRSAGRMQADDAVDDRALVDDAADRPVVVAERGDLRGAARGLRGQRVAQRVVRVDEAGARQVQAHQLHQHLVGIGGAVEGAGAGAVVALRFGFEQLLARGLADGVALAHARLLVVGQARGHRPGRHEDRRQVAEAERADQQARHDLVAHAQVQRGVEHVVRQRHRGRQRDHLAREQRQLHAGAALGDAVAHRRHAAGDLRGGADAARGLLEQERETLQRLVRREHVVVGVDDAEVGRVAAAQRGLVAGRTGGETVGEVAARQRGAVRTVAGGGVDARQVGGATIAAALADALGDFGDDGVQGGHGLQFLKVSSPPPLAGEG